MLSRWIGCLKVRNHSLIIRTRDNYYLAGVRFFFNITGNITATKWLDLGNGKFDPTKLIIVFKA